MFLQKQAMISLTADFLSLIFFHIIRGLDLSPYCHGSHGTPLIYDLYGVINHHGGILGGHYTSFGRLASTADWSKNEHGELGCYVNKCLQ